MIEIELFSQLVTLAENNILLVLMDILRITIHTVEYTELIKYDLIVPSVQGIRIIQILMYQGMGE